MLRSAVFAILGVLSSVSLGFPGYLLDGGTLSNQSLTGALKMVQPGTVVFLGENHGLREHQEQHMAVIRALQAQGLLVSVGMEFFYWPDQWLVDEFIAGKLSEREFLRSIDWGSPSFDYYRDQVLAPRLDKGERVVALNAPRSLTRKVARSGLESLDPGEQILLPPAFALGRRDYKERFRALIGTHFPPEKLEHYFAAQSVWDDTMAWKITEFMEAHREHVLVVIVGEFHVAYGGGLPDRLLQRNPEIPQVVFSQINRSGLSEEELLVELRPHPQYGRRADWLFVSEARP